MNRDPHRLTLRELETALRGLVEVINKYLSSPAPVSQTFMNYIKARMANMSAQHLVVPGVSTTASVDKPNQLC